jgi:hypothetical protein
MLRAKALLDFLGNAVTTPMGYEEANPQLMKFGRKTLRGPTDI